MRLTLMLETTSTGAVLPSYDVETRVMGEVRQRDTKFYTNIAFGFCIFFMLLEGVTGP